MLSTKVGENREFIMPLKALELIIDFDISYNPEFITFLRKK